MKLKDLRESGPKVEFVKDNSIPTYIMQLSRQAFNNYVANDYTSSKNVHDFVKKLKDNGYWISNTQGKWVTKKK